MSITTKEKKVKTIKILGGIIAGVMACNMSYATEQEELCALDTENFSYVSETDACVLADPCSSSDAATVEKYCVTNVNTIPLSSNGIVWFGHNGKYCWYYQNGEETQDGGKRCEDVRLTPGKWAIRFPTYVVKGASMCSGQKGKFLDSMPEDVLIVNNAEKKYCWCKAEGLYASITDNTPRILLENFSWVFVNDYLNAENCETCAGVCARTISRDINMRRELYKPANQ